MPQLLTIDLQRLMSYFSPNDFYYLSDFYYLRNSIEAKKVYSTHPRKLLNTEKQIYLRHEKI